MDQLHIATVQFENKSGDKAYNLARIRAFCERASHAGCNVIAFHECSITGYTFARQLSRHELEAVAEQVPDGPSTRELIRIAEENKIIVLAGLFEKDDEGKLYNTYICVGGEKEGLIAKYRKLHPFISPHLSAGNGYTIFTLPQNGWKCGILICYDNNIVENVRATALLGAEVIFMPHVTMCTPSTRPGAGFVDLELWGNRVADPTSLRAEFCGLKGRAWLMKWLPARAYDNAVYVVFSNPIGLDDNQLKNGCSMIIDPYGDVMSEATALGDDMATAYCTTEKLSRAGGWRYRQARRPELYRHVIGAEHETCLKVSWLEGKSGSGKSKH